MRRVLVLVTIAVAASCAGRATLRSTAEEQSGVDLAELWIDPIDLESRDLFYGPGGRSLAPDPDERYEILAVDTSGYSGGYDVRDRRGTTWSVKTGIEAQTEVAVSRILWAIGYHQPPTYLLVDWTANDARAQTAGAARFRRDTEAEQTVGDWSWYENPFVGTQPFNGLIVANLILNNWDWKTSNNKVYAVPHSIDGPRRHYVVRDLGASLGKTSFPQFLRWTPMRGLGQGSRNDLEDFEAQGFIKEVEGEKVTFDYKGIHPGLVKAVSVRDVVWVSTLMDRLTHEQLLHAFRAAGYPPAYQERFAAKLKGKIQEGRALASN